MPYWKPFLATYRRHILRFMQISEWRWRITCRYRTVDQNGNFHKLKMADGRHFENSFILISQSELSDFDQIWYVDANFHSEDGYLTKIEIFQIQDGGRTPYWKSFWLYFGPYWPINVKFGMEMTNHMQIEVTWPKMEIFPNSRWRISLNYQLTCSSVHCFLRTTPFTMLLKTLTRH